MTTSHVHEGGDADGGAPASPSAATLECCGQDECSLLGGIVFDNQFAHSSEVELAIALPFGAVRR